ncbi:MAG: GGDEF domain-containing protein [Gemmatimonadales bacterium]|nr:GGDEF domain-containing protein [Gemmatimonadales bacterium]
MALTPLEPSKGNLTSAFAIACRQARTDSELFERCRDALVQEFHSDAIWLEIQNGEVPVRAIGPAERPESVEEIARCTSGQTDLVVFTTPEQAATIRPAALALALSLSVTIELRSVLLSRQGELDDAVFQLRALRQVARLLSSVHSTEESEILVLDFMAEVFFAWWACLYRVRGDRYLPLRFRALNTQDSPVPIDRERFDAALPAGSQVSTAEDVALRSLIPASAELVVPLDVGGERMAFLVLGPRMNETPYGKSERELASTLSFAAAIALKNAELVERLHNAATTDELTGLLNRRALEERLSAEISRSSRHQVRTTIAMIDLDRFKVINDTLGHAAGDRFLTMVAQLLTRQVRTMDVVGRLGGEEFVVILPMTSAPEAMVFIARVQSAMARLAGEHPEFGSATMSIGIAEAPRHGTTPAALLAAADAALYAAKRDGRDGAEVAPDA